MTKAKDFKDYDDIKSSFEKYISTLKKTTERREQWTKETKAKILESLTTIKELFEFDWQVEKMEDIKNVQTVSLNINNSLSGIVDVNIDEKSGKEIGFKDYTKYGGYLAYSQSYNGKINVFIGFPYIDQWVSQVDIKVIDTIEPNQVTQSLISDHVVKFLEAMVEWEGKDEHTIGFK